MKTPMLSTINRQSLFFSFIIPRPFTMKPQTLVVLVSLIGMLLTLQQAEGVLGNEAVQANGNIAFTCQFNLIGYKLNCTY